MLFLICLTFKANKRAGRNIQPKLLYITSFVTFFEGDQVEMLTLSNAKLIHSATNAKNI